LLVGTSVLCYVALSVAPGHTTCDKKSHFVFNLFVYLVLEGGWCCHKEDLSTEKSYFTIIRPCSTNKGHTPKKSWIVSHLHHSRVSLTYWWAL
jgi:hypothetical protein